MPLDLTRRHAPRIHRYDLVVKTGPTRLPLGHNLGIEVAWRLRGVSNSNSPTRSSRSCGPFRCVCCLDGGPTSGTTLELWNLLLGPSDRLSPWECVSNSSATATFFPTNRH